MSASAKHPLLWDVASGQWERRYVEKPGGFDDMREDGVTAYIPSRKQVLFAIRDQVWFYDYDANAWTGKTRTGCPLTGYENGCYDPKAERLYVAYLKQFAFYDLKSEKWTEIKAPGQPEQFASSNTVSLNFDTVNNVVLYQRREGNTSRGYLAVYDPAANAWTTPPRTFPKEHDGGLALVNSYYDPELNAHFFYLANDSSDRPGTMLAYRYKPASATGAKMTGDDASP